MPDRTGRAAGPGGGEGPPAPHPYAYPAPRRRSPAFWVALFFGFLLAGSLLFNFVLLAMVAAGSLFDGDAARQVEYREKTISGKGPGKILVLDVEGVIAGADSFNLATGATRNTVEAVRTRLAQAAGDPAIKGVILRIDSPGGEVTASDLIHQEIKEFRRKTGLEVVALFMDTAASGGYYVACAAGTVVAHATTVTGSIGVIMALPKIKKLLDRHGVEFVVFKSGKMKDAGAFYRDLDAAEARVLEGIVAQMHGKFLDVVAAGRPKLERARIAELADGRIVTGPQAHVLGLVDEIGTLERASQIVMRSAGITTARLVTYEEGFSLSRLLSRQLGAPERNPLSRGMAGLLAPRLMYLWLPGR